VAYCENTRSAILLNRVIAPTVEQLDDLLGSDLFERPCNELRRLIHRRDILSPMEQRLVICLFLQGHSLERGYRG